MHLKKFFYSLIIVGFVIGSFPHRVAADENPLVIVIKDHKFSPAELRIPANKKVKIIVENQDATPEEFESFELNREKVVSGNGKITVFIGPLKPGTYKYFGDFHQDTAQGTIIAE
jgi:plastocyanin